MIIWVSEALAGSGEMVISPEIAISHEERLPSPMKAGNMFFSESHSRTQPVSQLLAGGVTEKGQVSGPFG